ncbi:MAG TPA: gamma-glutamylcyclotransferase family protein [Puia sp.]|nr:gamma-glutamylcyclotransferase family protein [Puia sp.]
MNKEYLFAYGTLRKGYRLDLKKKVAEDIEYIGTAKVKAVLYDVGTYPGAIKKSGRNEIIGDVFLINNPKKVFKVLDFYEGYSKSNEQSSEFVRRKSITQLRSGQRLSVWIYWYNFPVAGKPKINYKNYLNFLKYRKTA